VTPEEISDADLARGAASGDERAFSRLVTRHKEPLYRFARRLTGDSDQAYEVTQQTFVSAWGAIGRYDGRAFDVWLRAIALNKVRDLSRRRAVRRLFTGGDDEAASVPDPARSAEGRLLDQERLTALDRAIAKLPDGLKAPLVLTVFDGRSQAEAGAILGLNAKAVETRVYRAKKRLAEALGSPGERD
jgi:RNA polymerase sigma-70 factor (ECF subfamily)